MGCHWNLKVLLTECRKKEKKDRSHRLLDRGLTGATGPSGTNGSNGTNGADGITGPTRSSRSNMIKQIRKKYQQPGGIIKATN